MAIGSGEAGEALASPVFNPYSYISYFRADLFIKYDCRMDLSYIINTTILAIFIKMLLYYNEFN